jgi:hypothetical protein
MPYRVVLLVLAAMAAAPLAVAADRPKAAARDKAGDVEGGLDLVRVALALGADGRLRGELTMSVPWDAAALRGTGTGPPAAACLRLYTTRDPTADVADYLVCATPARDAERYTARVLRERRNAPPKTVASATVSRPTGRTMYLRFSRSSVARPERVRFAGEVTSPGPECSRSLGCRDTAPDAPKTVELLLRPTSQGR